MRHARPSPLSSGRANDFQWHRDAAGGGGMGKEKTEGAEKGWGGITVYGQMDTSSCSGAQVVGYTDSPYSVKIRYKLVPPGERNASPAR